MKDPSPEKESAADGRKPHSGQECSINSAQATAESTSRLSDAQGNFIESSVFASEIERSFVSALWRHPEFIDLSLLTIDPEIHITDRCLRAVMQTICVVYWDTGTADWTLVIHALREYGMIKQCGGLQGLNTIYTDGGFSNIRYLDPGPIIKEYMDLLWQYAEQRNLDPTKIPIRYTGGKGRIVPNPNRRPKGPSDIGDFIICGRPYRLIGWRDGDGLDCKLIPKPRGAK